MTIPELHPGIFCIQGCNPCLPYFIGHRNLCFRLAAPTDTSTSAGHYLYEIIVGLIFLPLVKKFSGVLSTMNDGQLKRCIPNLYISFTNPVHPAYRIQFQVVIRGILAGYQEMGCSCSRFHNTSCISENHTSPRSLSHQFIIAAHSHVFQFDSLFTHPTGKFSCRYHMIHIP